MQVFSAVFQLPKGLRCRAVGMDSVWVQKKLTASLPKVADRPGKNA
jgi:hypothetical protein